jgi:hypothetical protein
MQPMSARVCARIRVCSVAISFLPCTLCVILACMGCADVLHSVAAHHGWELDRRASQRRKQLAVDQHTRVLVWRRGLCSCSAARSVAVKGTRHACIRCCHGV